MNTIIFGLRAIIEGIKSGTNINKIYLQKGLRGHLFSELELLIKQNRIATSFVPVEKLDRLSYNKNHQGAVAQISPVAFYDLEELIEQTHSKKKTPLFVVLDQVSDVRNFGAIIRTCECAGVDGVIIQQSGSAPINAETIKTSAGAAFKIPISRVSHIKDAIYILRAFGIDIIASTEKTNHLIYDLSLNQPLAVVMGSEHKGISPSVLKVVDRKARLPLHGEIDSLNVSVACGAFLYEVIRQRLK